MEKKFEEVLTQASLKLKADSEISLTKERIKKEILSEFTKPIYEFMLYINKVFNTNLLEDGHGAVREYEIFEFNKSAMAYRVNHPLIVKVANEYDKVVIASRKLNTSISFSCDTEFNVLATIGYSDIKRFHTSTELIEELAFMISKENLGRK